MTTNDKGVEIKLNADAASEKPDGAATTGTDGNKIYTMTIIGQIEGHYTLSDNQKTTKYEQIIPSLVSVEENPDIHGLFVILNTMGGDVEAGLAIAEMIASMSKPSVSLVLGGGHSIGVPLAVAVKRSFIVPSATMTIHPVRMNGLVIGVPQTFYYFNRIQERIVSFIERNSNMTGDKYRELMLRTDQIATDTGTIIDGNEAVQYGLIDEIGGLSKAIETLKKMMEQKNNPE